MNKMQEKFIIFSINNSSSLRWNAMQLTSVFQPVLLTRKNVCVLWRKRWTLFVETISMWNVHMVQMWLVCKAVAQSSPVLPVFVIFALSCRSASDVTNKKLTIKFC